MTAMMQRRPRRLVRTILALALSGSILASPAWASGSSMPWEAPLQSILDSIEGPVAKIIASHRS